MRVAPIIRLCLALSSAACSPPERSMSGSVVGYLHSLAKSRFDVGSVIEETDELGSHRVVGDKGVFATNLVTHATTAIPNSGVPSASGDVFPGNAGEQDAAVLDYFTMAGLPSSQISSVTANQAGGSDPKGGAGPGRPAVVAWYSVIHRSYEGVPIEDSAAWAMLGKSGNALVEQVYWPDIPEDVWARTREFQAMLADPRGKAQFIGRFPAEASRGELVVRHTAWYWSGEFEAKPCYRFALNGPSICLDEEGRALRLADEGAIDSSAAGGPLR
jgi:hypothetical protein